jgi:glucose/arabinose dehydrogenase
LPQIYQSGAFIGLHGSWNRAPRSGYKVIFVPFSGGSPAGKPIDVLTEFLNDDGEARGRPVGVAIDNNGALLVADDVGNTIWRVTPASKTTAVERSVATKPDALRASGLPATATRQTGATSGC